MAEKMVTNMTMEMFLGMRRFPRSPRMASKDSGSALALGTTPRLKKLLPRGDVGK